MIFGNDLLNAFQNCKTNSRAGASTGNHNLQRNDAEKSPASSPLKRDGVAVLPADEWSEPCSFESTTPCHGRSAGRVEGEQLSSWKILVPMRLPQ